MALVVAGRCAPDEGKDEDEDEDEGAEEEEIERGSGSRIRCPPAPMRKEDVSSPSQVEEEEECVQRLLCEQAMTLLPCTG
ncbi:hypothetical protein BVC80_9089g10 [Macleaya cordata]|uniref:Uncharacterized protein n=1 Tax=Macleaya cordata TaxID=56857 RepID=A0A200PQE2_MACCD|nr:hypothetical protein BVC80_9089g10 [Macleaya cordata]